MAELDENGYELLKELSDGAQIVRDPRNTGGMPLAITDGIDYIWIDEDNIAELVGTIAAAFDVTVNPPANADVSGTLNEQLLQVAINNDVEVEFAYAKGSGAVIEQRRLNPVTLSVAKGHQIVTGFDPDRDDIRAYRLDRIKGTVSV